MKLTQEQKSAESRLPQLLQEAVTAHHAGDLDSAAPLYRRFLALHPAHPTALQLLGLLHSQRGEYAPAIEYMQESLRRFPQQAEVANNLGNALSLSGNNPEALVYYRRAVELAPRYSDAWRNLGLCYMEQEQFKEAAGALQRCLEIWPEDAAAWLGLGNVYKRGNQFDQALQCYQQALVLRPGYAEAHHNIGLCLRFKNRAADAVSHYQDARRLGLNRAELYHNLGNALLDTLDVDAAIEAYQAALERDPEDINSHRYLNTLLWEQGRKEEYLQSYRDALGRRPASKPLIHAYAMALNQQEAYAEAERVLRRDLGQLADAGELKSLLAFALEGQQRWDEALQLHADAVAAPGSVPDLRISYARALLACNRVEQALEQAREAAAQMPFNQRALAYLGLCWRLLGDERDAILNDYEKFIRVYDVPVPPPYADTGTFNKALAEVLQPLHTGKQHPPEQTLRGGTQTHGDLFLRHEPEISALVTVLKQCIQDYVRELTYHEDHPFLMRKNEVFTFADSWSVCLRRDGYHTMHVHPRGWISSAYYVQVPVEITVSDTPGGSIKFGEPDIDLGSPGTARRVLQPAMGQLILFPSYMWHGTVPFQSDEPRMTVAFDVVPAS